MRKEDQEYLLKCEPSAFYMWLWSKWKKKQINKDQWFKLTKWYENHRDQLAQDIKDVFGLDK